MINRILLLILSLILFFMVVGGLNVQALTITNVSAHPNPFSPNGDGVKDTTTISFVISTSDDKQPAKVTITVDVDGDGFGLGNDLEIEDGVPFDIGENKYLWDGSGLGDNAYLFKIIVWDANGKPLNDSFSSIIIDTAPSQIENIFVSLSSFSPNGDGINDVTEISFDLSATNPPGFLDNNIGTIAFAAEQSSYPLLLALFPFPFGAYLKVIPEYINPSTKEITFTINGGYKGAIVRREFTVSPGSGIQVGKELSGGDLYDTISSITEVSGATDGDSITLGWFTGNAVVKIYSSNGTPKKTLNTSPTYIGDRRNYHVRWGPLEKSDDFPDGVYTYRILAEDGTGNVSQRSGQIILSNATIEILAHKPMPDRISPANQDNQYDETSISYNLSKTGIVTVKIFDANDQLIKTLVERKPQEAGAHSAIWDGALSEDGLYTYVITVMDSLTSETVKASGNIVVDNQPPEKAPRLNPLPLYTNKDLITISGTAEAGATVQIYVGDNLAGEVTASLTTGEFIIPYVPLNEGTNTIKTLALDAVANKSDYSTPLKVKLDKIPPVTIVRNVPEGWQQKATVNLETVDAGGSGVSAIYYTTDGSIPTPSSENKILPETDEVMKLAGEVKLPEQDGVYLLKFFSQDNAGNIESVKQAANYIQLDKTSPTLVIISKSTEKAFAGVLPMIIISGTADDQNGSGLKLVEIQITSQGTSPAADSWLIANGTSDWLYSFIPAFVLPSEEMYAVHVRATDNAGNQKEITDTIVLAPEAPIELTATPISEGRIRLTWKDEGGIYNIYRANYSGFVPDDAKTLVASVKDVKGVWIDDNTTNQTEYYYKIGRDTQDATSNEEANAIADKTPPAIENISATPNPFSPNKDGVDDIITISFTLTEETFVTLEIYAPRDGDNFINVKQLVYEVLPAGDNLVEWDGRDSKGRLVDEGTYVYRFEKASTLDATGNTLSQDISGTITCTPVPPLEVKMLEAQPNPFSPDGDKINDVINLNYTLSNFADYVVVNIFDTSGSQQKVIARLKVEALEYYFSYEGEQPQWVSVHVKDGIPPGRSAENYYLKPNDPKNVAPPPFGIFNKPPDAQTVDEYLAAYQADYPNWRPVPFTIQWGGQGATEQGAYVYSLAAAQYSGISSVRKTGVILLEGLVVVPDDKTPPIVARTYPQDGTVHSAKLEFVSADLDDAHGTGADLTASTIRLIGPNGTIPGRPSNDGVDTITWTLNEGLADDGSDDGVYSISVLPVDYSKNRLLNPLIFTFEYNTSINDTTKPQVSNAVVVLVSEQTEREEIKLEKERKVTISGKGKYIERIQVNVSDVGSGIDLSASLISLLDPTGAVVTAEKKETPSDRFSGQLLLRNIASLTDGEYTLKIQPVDNAGNGGKIVDYVFKYITVDDDTKPPIIEADTLAFTSEDGASIGFRAEENFINTPIYSLTVEIRDEPPSTGINFRPEDTTIQLHDASGEEIKGFTSYESQAVTQYGTFSATIRLTLEKPLSIDGSDDGDYTVTVKISDNAENSTKPISLTFKYDTIAPSVSAITLSPNKSIHNVLPEISVGLGDNGSGIDQATSVIYLLAPDGNRIPVEKVFKQEKELVTIILKPDQRFAGDGLYTIVCDSQDNAGNVGEKASATFQLDNKPPSVISMIPERGASVNGEVSQIQITFYDENGLDFKHTDTKLEIMSPPELIIPQHALEGKLIPADGLDNSLQFHLIVPLSISGVYTISGKVADKAGNLLELENITPPLAFTFDNVAPAVSSVLAVKAGTGELLELSEGKVINEQISRVKVDASDLTSGMDLESTKILLTEEDNPLPPVAEVAKLLGKGETGKIVPGALHFEVNEKTTIEWIVNDVQALKPGVYKVEVEATDMAQNVTKKAVTFGFSPAPRFEPEILSITPKNKQHFNTPISQIIMVVKDNSGTGIDFDNSTLKVTGPGVSTADYQSNNGVNTLFWNFAQPFATDHSDDGEYVVTVKVEDKASNSTETAITFTYDTEPPKVKTGSELQVIPTPGAVINTAGLKSVSVTLEDLSGIDLNKSTIELKGPRGVIAGQKTDNGVDNLIFEFAPLKSDGSDDGKYTITVTPADKVGNVAFPLEFTFMYDTRPPIIRTLVPPAGSTVFSPLYSVSATLDDREGSGVDVVGSSIQLIRLTDRQIIRGEPGNNGVDTITLNFAKFAANGSDNGIYHIEVRPKDLLGNAAENPLIFEFTYTVKAHLLFSTIPEANAVLSQPLSDISVTVEAQSGAEINLEGSIIQLFNPKGDPKTGKLTHNGMDTLFLKLDTSLATDGSDDGWYTIKVMAMDNRGNSVNHTAKFLYDTTAPEVVWTQPENGIIINENINSISARLSDEHAGVDLSESIISLPGIEGRKQNNGVDTIKLQFAQLPGDGVYEMTVQPRDVLGNTPPEPLQFQFTLDTTPPTVISTEPANGALLVNTRLSQIKAILNDGAKGSGVDLSKSTITLTGPRGKITGKEQIDSNTLNFVFDMPLTLSGADDGKYIIEVFAIDKAENIAKPFISSFVYDTVQPGGPNLSNISALPVSFSPNGDGASDTTRISFALSKKARMTINVYNSNSELTRTLLDSKEMNEGENFLIWDGTSGTGDVLLDGAYTVVFNATDADGLTGALESVHLFIDTQSPIISNLTVSNNPFTPDNDGFADVTKISFSVTNSTPEDNVVFTIYDAQMKRIASLPVEPTFAGNGNYSATWNGLDANYDGEYIYEVIAKDLANNIRTLSGTIVLDRNAPSVEVIGPESAVATNKAPLFITGSAADFSGIRLVEALVSEETISPGIIPKSEVWQRVMFSGDGIDNDLDGTVDEEEYNQKDDDGDRKIDEDLRATASIDLPVHWIYNFEPKSDGKYTLNIRATDNVGHTTIESDSIVVTVDYDTVPPKHLSTVAFKNGKEDAKYKNGDEIRIVSKWDTRGYIVTADFSAIDSQLTKEVFALDNGDGTYTLQHKINPDNKASDGMKTIRITAVDAASNKTVIDAIVLELDNTPPKIISVRPVEPVPPFIKGGLGGIYKNGDLISLTVTCDSADYEVSADFSNVDSTYALKSEAITNNGDKNYTIKYQISNANTRPDAKSLPIAISVFDDVNTTIDQSFTVELDNTPPEFISVSAKDKVLSNSIIAVLTITLDAPGYTLLADFSRLDSKYTKGAETVTDNEDRTFAGSGYAYTVKYTISEGNTKEDTQNALIQFKAFDAVENAKEYSFSVILNNVAPQIFKVNSQDADTIYKNGEAINLLIQTDATGYKVKADFSSLDSQYEPGDEKTNDQGDGTYIVAYMISEENKTGAEETLKNLPVIIAISDESYTSVYDAFTLQLDNQPPTIEISSPSEEKPVTTEAKIKIIGKTEALSTMKIAPASVESSYDTDTGEFSFTLDLKRGENRITLQVTDLAGNKTVKELLITYRPVTSEIVSAAKGGEIVLPEEVDDGIIDNDTRIIIPPSALPYDAVVSITLVKDALPVSDNPQIAEDNPNPLAAYRISLKSVDGKDISGVLLKPTILVLQFSQDGKTARRQEGNGVINPAASSYFSDTTFDIEKLKVFRWDGVHWNQIGGKAQRNNTVIVKVDNISGLFAIFEIAEAPQVFKVYKPRPNPFTPNGDGVNDFVRFYFENPQGVETIVRIYDLRGALVRELTNVVTTEVTWDGKDEDGKLLELGLYIYQIKVGDNVKGGTVVLAR
ncbi:hypothetical protein FJZ31_24425 [Candidatus Poribacteria bacterium]|nr:hypothetical protein [Candidatus Poribacteria bacterium]